MAAFVRCGANTGADGIDDGDALRSPTFFPERPPPAYGATRNLAGGLCCVNTTRYWCKSPPLAASLSLKTLPLLNCFTFVNDYFVFSNRFV